MAEIRKLFSWPGHWEHTTRSRRDELLNVVPVVPRTSTKKHSSNMFTSLAEIFSPHQGQKKTKKIGWLYRLTFFFLIEVLYTRVQPELFRTAKNSMDIRHPTIQQPSVFYSPMSSLPSSRPSYLPSSPLSHRLGSPRVCDDLVQDIEEVLANLSFWF